MSQEKTTSILYRNYVLIMLTLVYVFNFIDRQLLVILQESIKKDLSLTDTHLGLLSGFTFAIFYVTMGIPIAILADKSNRKNIVAISLGLWSLMTALSGMAMNFVQLLFARIGVGVGEAGGSPPAHAMISDYFPPTKRATALAIYSTGIYIGMMFGFVMGGYLTDNLGWRTAFYVLGIPGVLFSLLFYFTVREPKRGAMDPTDTIKQENHSFIDVFKILFPNPTFIFLGLATGLHVFCIYGVFNWAPSFLRRLHEMSSAEIGLAFGIILGVGGALGTFIGGHLTDRYGKNDKRWYLKIPAYGIILSIPFLLAALFVANSLASLVCFGICSSLYSMYLGPSIAVAHQLVPASMRALTSAILFFILNLIGLGFGPLTVGILSDALTPSLGMESIRWAMAFIAVVSSVAILLFFAAARKMQGK